MARAGIYRTGVRIGVAGALIVSGFALPANAKVADRPYFNTMALVIVFAASDFSEDGGTAPIAEDFYLLDSASGTAGNDLITGDMATINFNGGRPNASSDGSNAAWEFQITGQTFGGRFNSTGPHQTLDANDSYTAFGIDNDTDVDLLGAGGRASRFYVASNAPFDIHAQATDLVASGGFSSLDYSNIRYRLRVNTTGGGGAYRWGQAAQNPTGSAQGITFPQGGNNGWTLQNITGGDTKVFDGGRRTARARGTILEQAVSFQSRYNLIGAGINGNNYDLSMGEGELGATVTYTVYTP